MLNLTDKWMPILQKQEETGHGYQVASVHLMDGRVFDDVTILAASQIVQVGHSKKVPFKEQHIERIVVNHGIPDQIGDLPRPRKKSGPGSPGNNT